MINFNEIQGCVFHPQGPKEIANIQIDNIIKFFLPFISSNSFREPVKFRLTTLPISTKFRESSFYITAVYINCK